MNLNFSVPPMVSITGPFGTHLLTFQQSIAKFHQNSSPMTKSIKSLKLNKTLGVRKGSLKSQFILTTIFSSEHQLEWKFFTFPFPNDAQEFSRFCLFFFFFEKSIKKGKTFLTQIFNSQLINFSMPMKTIEWTALEGLKVTAKIRCIKSSLSCRQFIEDL